MYYKVIYNNEVIDVLDNLVYLKYQQKYDRMIFSNRTAAQAIFSSDRKHIWHVQGLPKPSDEYDTVVLEEIDRYQYFQLKEEKNLNSNKIKDDFVIKFMLGDLEELTQSLKRLLSSGKIEENSVKIFCKNNNISEEEIFSN